MVLPDADGAPLTVRWQVMPTLAGEVADGGVRIQAGEATFWHESGDRWRIVSAD